MGMDVYGSAPTSEAGKYFRNSVWSWRPLADYVCWVAPEITSHCRYWHSNDGDGLDAAGSIALADALQRHIDNGKTAIYAADYMARQDGTPDEDCNLCEGTGVRRDQVGVTSGMPNRLIDKADHPRHGQKGWCNKCDGLGHVRPYSAYYPFSVENVTDFIAFLRDCGGFKIH